MGQDYLDDAPQMSRRERGQVARHVIERIGKDVTHEDVCKEMRRLGQKTAYPYSSFVFHYEKRFGMTPGVYQRNKEKVNGVELQPMKDLSSPDGSQSQEDHAPSSMSTTFGNNSVKVTPIEHASIFKDPAKLNNLVKLMLMCEALGGVDVVRKYLELIEMMDKVIQ